jgi:outer membrane murein-binding lipoprotein Lpp
MHPPTAPSNLQGEESRLKINQLLTIQPPNQNRLSRVSLKMRSKPMFGKVDVIDSLNRDLARTRNKRDALASEVTTLTAEIAVLETRLSAENERRERERAASEIEAIKKQVRDCSLAFVPVLDGIRAATEKAAEIVPDAREFDELLLAISTEVTNAIDGLLGDLDQRIAALRAHHVAPDVPQPINGPAELSQDNDRVLHLPEWLPCKKPIKKESVEDQCNTAAA